MARTYPHKYPFYRMQVGEMFWAPVEPATPGNAPGHRIRAAASFYGRKYGLRFECHNVVIRGRLAIRVYRTA